MWHTGWKFTLIKWSTDSFKSQDYIFDGPLCWREASLFIASNEEKRRSMIPRVSVQLENSELCEKVFCAAWGADGRGGKRQDSNTEGQKGKGQLLSPALQGPRCHSKIHHWAILYSFPINSLKVKICKTFLTWNCHSLSRDNKTHYKNIHLTVTIKMEPKCHLWPPHPVKFKNVWLGTSLVAQWIRIHLPMQGTQVPALVREDPTCRRATSPCATTTEPVRHNYWSPCA